MHTDKLFVDATLGRTEGFAQPRDGAMEVVNRLESNVRSYCRGFPAVFSKAKGAEIHDQHGSKYLDFLSAAGSLNYGHNDARINDAVIEYLREDGIIQALDMATMAKSAFMSAFERSILAPRGMSYKVQFTGPTGTNSVEAALKLARKVTGRRNIAAFTNAFHGVSLGALAATGNGSKRGAAGVSLNDVVRLPYDGYIEGEFDSIAFARKLFDDPSSGYEKPAAFIVETVQGEGGLNVATAAWMRALAKLAKDIGALLIIDDIQAGCGRTGTFFSFETFDVQPDMVCLSKSISGNGSPMALLLIAPEIDIWAPGEHNGTFRGNNLAFVAARAALAYWNDEKFIAGLAERAERIESHLDGLVEKYPALLSARKGRGLFQGISFTAPEDATRVRDILFDNRIIMESSGAHGEVLKAMPPLNIPMDQLNAGLAALERALGTLEYTSLNIHAKN